MIIKLLAITPDAEKLIEQCARVCYDSVPTENYVHGTLIQNLLKSGHDSVMEHATATFHIDGISRACSHQLVRHRLCTFHQRSQRYCSEKNFEYVYPNLQNPDTRDRFTLEFEGDMKIIQSMYNKWKERGLKNEDARYVLPNACTTELVMTANFREWRHIFEMRCDIHAQEEIRRLVRLILGSLWQQCPNVFGDLYQKFIVEPK